MKGTVALFHQEVPAGAPPDEADVLSEVAAVRTALETSGWRTVAVSLGLDLERAAGALRRQDPRVVFNLVETVAGDGRLIHLGTALLDHLRLPYTGCPTAAMFLTSGKVWGKRVLQAEGIPTPPFAVPGDEAAMTHLVGRTCVLKAEWEHASIGLDPGALLTPGSAGELADRLTERQRTFGIPLFAEGYVEGREFNLSLLAGEVLPPAEIRFEGFPEGQPKMVDYRAKWNEESAEYRHTVRTFEFPAADGPLLAELAGIARHCWQAFGLRGYARVDFRVDSRGRPWVLEVNANPCISPDGGFVAAASRAGLDLSAVTSRILADVPGL